MPVNGLLTSVTVGSNVKVGEGVSVMVWLGVTDAVAEIDGVIVAVSVAVGVHVSGTVAEGGGGGLVSVGDGKTATVGRSAISASGFAPPQAANNVMIREKIKKRRME